MTMRSSLLQLFSSGYVSQYGVIYVAGMVLDVRKVTCMEIRVFYAVYSGAMPCYMHVLPQAAAGSLSMLC